MANTMKLFQSGAVGFIEWLGVGEGGRSRSEANKMACHGLGQRRRQNRLIFVQKEIGAPTILAGLSVRIQANEAIVRVLKASVSNSNVSVLIRRNRSYIYRRTESTQLRKREVALLHHDCVRILIGPDSKNLIITGQRG